MWCFSGGKKYTKDFVQFFLSNIIVICIDRHFSSVLVSTHMVPQSCMYMYVICCNVQREITESTCKRKNVRQLQLMCMARNGTKISGLHGKKPTMSEWF